MTDSMYVPGPTELMVVIGFSKKIVLVTDIDDATKAADVLRLVAFAVEQNQVGADEINIVTDGSGSIIIDGTPLVLNIDDGHLEAEYEDRHGVPDE